MPSAVAAVFAIGKALGPFAPRPRTASAPRLFGMDVWIWVIVGFVVAAVGAAVWLKRFGAKSAEAFSTGVTPERARAASDRLSAEQHKTVHRHLATDNLLAAAQEIHRATKQSSRDSLLDAQSLRRHPQIWRAPAAEPSTEGLEAGTRDADDRGAEAATPEPVPSATAAPDSPAALDAPGAPAVASESSPSNEAEWTIPEDWTQEYGGEAGQGERHMEFTHHDGTELRRFSTQDLPDAERDQLMSQLRDGDMSSAAKLIADKVGIDEDEVANALRANHESGNDRLEGIAVRFDRGDGTPIEFSTQDLPEDEREAFVDAMRAGDLIAAAQVVSRHTGLSPEQALGLLTTFRRRRD